MGGSVKYLISTDIGTTAVKTSLLTDKGSVICTESHGYPLLSEGTRAEQDPRLWWEAFCTTVRIILERCGGVSSSGRLGGTGKSKGNNEAGVVIEGELEAVVLSGQMQDLIAVQNGGVVGNAILYSDTRAVNEFSSFAEDFGFERLRQTVMHTPDASSLPAKIRYLQGQGNWNNTTQLLLGAHDYVCWKLTGRVVTDPTNASTTGLMDYERGAWSGEILSRLGVLEHQLPIIEPAGTVTGKLTKEAAADSRLPEGLRVIHGAGDAASNTLGSGAGVPGTISCYLGTSGWIAATASQPSDPTSGIFNLKHPNGSDTISIGAMRTTGGNVAWLIDAFALKEDPYAELQATAELAEPGSSGLIYLPYLQGERCPFTDPHARGAYIGIKRNTGKPELFRAVLEGIAYSLASIFRLIRFDADGNQGGKRIIASGGGARNALLLEIIASVIGVPVTAAENSVEAGILGNMLIAGNAFGWIDSYRIPEYWIPARAEYQPDIRHHARYTALLAVFEQLYPALKNEFQALACIRIILSSIT